MFHSLLCFLTDVASLSIYFINTLIRLQNLKQSWTISFVNCNADMIIPFKVFKLIHINYNHKPHLIVKIASDEILQFSFSRCHSEFYTDFYLLILFQYNKLYFKYNPLYIYILLFDNIYTYFFFIICRLFM